MVTCYYCHHPNEVHSEDFGGCIFDTGPFGICPCPWFVPVGVVEMADTSVSKTDAERREGSTPSLDTNLCDKHGAPVRVIVCPECLWETKVPFEIVEDEEPEPPVWFEKHPFTCAECSWGRDGAYHDFEEYRIHRYTQHGPKGEYCDQKEACDAQACPEHKHHDYDTNEHTWEQHHARTDHFPEEETDSCTCDSYDDWDMDGLEEIERALEGLDKRPVLAGLDGKDSYVKLSDVKRVVRKALVW